MKRVVLDAGSKKAWIVRIVLLHSSAIVLCAVGVYFAISLLSELGVNAIFLKYAFYLALYLFIPVTCQVCVDIWQTDFIIEEDCLLDVDLWLVTKVRYGPHRIYLDKVRIDNVPNPKKLLDSLDDYYFQMTGGYLP